MTIPFSGEREKYNKAMGSGIVHVGRALLDIPYILRSVLVLVVRVVLLQ